MNSDGTTEIIDDSEDRLGTLVDEAMAPAVEARGGHHFLLLIALVGLIAVLSYLLNELLS